LTDIAELQSVIQELRIAEEELRAQNEELVAAHAERDEAYRRYRELFDVSPDGLLVTDENGKILEANRTTAELLEVSPDRLPGKVLAVFVAPQWRRSFRTSLAGLASGREKVAESDLRLRLRSGDRRIVQARAVSIRMPGGLLEFRWALRDVTDQRSATTELRLLNAELAGRVAERTEAIERQQALLAAVLEQIPLGLAIVDESEQVVLANEAARRMLGRAGSPSSMAGYRLEGTPYDGDWPALRSLRSGEVVIGERVRIVRPDSEHAIVEINSGPIRDAAGRTVAAVSVFRDVTRDEQREQAEHEFVSNAAHELRTPLAAIVGAVEVLQAGAKEDPTERDRFLAHLERQCRRLEQLTTALLTLARVQTQDEAPRLEIVELSPLLTEIAQSLNPAPRVAVEVDCPKEAAVFANRVLLEEALVNLAMNAMKFTLRGTITLAATESDSGFVSVEVRDTGRGMKAADRKRAVERFYRGDDEATGGFGLGLAIVAAAAEAMGSKLEIESAPRKGTTVRLRLRAARVLAA
jgi:two-component system, OmpR family, phosphate regulon sensor histidine kinase PhoR